jgi:predicted ATPase
MLLTSASIASTRFPDLDEYPFNLGVFRNSPTLTFTNRVCFFVGENGAGKSTLLEAIVRKCNIHIWDRPKRHIVHASPYAGDLWKYLDLTLTKPSVVGGLFSAENFFEFADTLDDIAVHDPGQLKYFGGRLINKLSHGQGTLSYFEGRYRFPGLYFLDEPESALSPTSQARLVRLFDDLRKEAQSQFIIATHSPILLSLPGAQIFSFDGETIHETTREETATYLLYHQFLTDPETFFQM